MIERLTVQTGKIDLVLWGMENGHVGASGRDIAIYKALRAYEDNGQTPEEQADMQVENAALKSDLLDGSKTGYGAMRRENATLTKALEIACDMLSEMTEETKYYWIKRFTQEAKEALNDK
jgi:hypothetical protein